MYSITERVGTSKTGADGLMTFVSAIDSMQDCELFSLEAAPVFRNYLIQNNIRMILASRQADILRMPSYGEKITVVTMPYEYSRGVGSRNTVIYGADGLPCILTWSFGAFISVETGRIANIPKEVSMDLIRDKKLDMEYLDRKIELPDSSFSALEPVAVCNRHIDLNEHVNNAKYIEIALDLLPGDIRIKRMRAEYKRAAVLGNPLYPKLLALPGKYYVLLQDADGNPCAVTEFSL